MSNKIKHQHHFVFIIKNFHNQEFSLKICLIVPKEDNKQCFTKLINFSSKFFVPPFDNILFLHHDFHRESRENGAISTKGVAGKFDPFNTFRKLRMIQARGCRCCASPLHFRIVSGRETNRGPVSRSHELLLPSPSPRIRRIPTNRWNDIARCPRGSSVFSNDALASRERGGGHVWTRRKLIFDRGRRFDYWWKLIACINGILLPYDYRNIEVSLLFQLLLNRFY